MHRCVCRDIQHGCLKECGLDECTCTPNPDFKCDRSLCVDLSPHRLCYCETVVFFVILLCTGPINLIAGIGLVASPNSRADKVAAYNDAVAGFQTDIFSSWQGTIGGASANQLLLPITVIGNSDDVSPASSAVLTASLSFQDDTKVSVTFDFNRISQAFARTVSGVEATSSSVTQCPYESSKCTSAAAMNADCRSTYGNAARYFFKSASYCQPSYQSDYCGFCEYPWYLQSYCVVVNGAQSNNSNGWVEDPLKRSCRYPFSSATFQEFVVNKPTTTTSVPFYMYASTDPYLVLQAQTMGTSDFGVSRASQMKAGFSLIGLGLLLTLGAGGALLWLRKYKQEETARQAQQDSAMNNNSGAICLLPMDETFGFQQQGQAGLDPLGPNSQNQQQLYPPQQQQPYAQQQQQLLYPQQQQQSQLLYFVPQPQQQQKQIQQGVHSNSSCVPPAVPQMVT